MSKFKIAIISSVVVVILGIIYFVISTDNVNNIIKEEKITLKIVTNRTDLVDTKLQDMAKEYENLNPNIEVVIEGVKQPDKVLKMRAAAGESGDITIVPIDANKKSLASFYEPIDDLGFNYKNLIGYSLGLGNDNRLHAVNSGVGYAGIVYNKNSFKAAGIDKIPTTLGEFYETCEKLKTAGIIPFAINLSDEWPLQIYSDNFELPMETSNNINYSNDLVNKDLFDDDGGLYYSAKFLRSMKEKGYTEANFDESNWSSFKMKHAKGEIAMTFLESWYPEQLLELGAKKEDIGMFPFPDTNIIIINNEWRFGISKDCKHLEEAKKLFKWLFYEGKYSEACSINSAINEDKSRSWFLDELLSYNKPTLIGIPKTNETMEKFNNFQYALSSIFKEYIISDEPDKVIEKYNKLWRETSTDIKSEK